ncbi:MAG TPA: MFS transporter [Gaiellales bacterium]|nr:MFS transporter [Gaiellales bacterium]
MPEPASLRRNRHFQLLWIGQAASALGSRASTVAYPLLVLALTGSPAAAGLVGFAATIPYLVLQLPAGVLVDRVDRRRAMMACDAGRLTILAGVAAAVAMGQASLPLLIAAAFAEGCLTVVFNLAELSAIQLLVHSQQMEAALAQNEARVRGAGLAGQPLGGFLFGLGRAVPFAADAATYGMSLVTLAAIRRPLVAADTGGRRHPWTEMVEGLGWLWRQPFLRSTTLIVAGSNGLFQAVILAVIVVARAHGASPAVVGLILAGWGVGGLAGAAAAAWLGKRLPAAAVVIGANWVWTALLPVLALAPRPIVIGAAGAGMAFVGPAWNVVLGSIEMRLTPPALLRRVQAVQMTAAYGAIPLGSLIGGLMLDRLGPEEAVWALAACMLVVAVVATLTPSVRRPPVSAPAAASP